MVSHCTFLPQSLNCSKRGYVAWVDIFSFTETQNGSQSAPSYVGATPIAINRHQALLFDLTLTSLYQNIT